MFAVYSFWHLLLHASVCNVRTTKLFANGSTSVFKRKYTFEVCKWNLIRKKNLHHSDLVFWLFSFWRLVFRVTPQELRWRSPVNVSEQRNWPYVLLQILNVVFMKYFIHPDIIALPLLLANTPTYFLWPLSVSHIIITIHRELVTFLKCRRTFLVTFDVLYSKTLRNNSLVNNKTRLVSTGGWGRYRDRLHLPVDFCSAHSSHQVQGFAFWRACAQESHNYMYELLSRHYHVFCKAIPFTKNFNSFDFQYEIYKTLSYVRIIITGIYN